jgi:hypothetical protein
MHQIKLNSSVEAKEFEKNVKDVKFGQVGKVLTRGGAVQAQYLFKVSSPPGRFTQLDMNIKEFGKRNAVSAFELVASWKAPAES